MRYKKYSLYLVVFLLLFMCNFKSTLATTVISAPETIKAYSGGMLYGSNYYSDLTTRFSKKLYGSGNVAFCTGTLAQDAPNETMNNRKELDAGFLYLLKSQCKGYTDFNKCYKNDNKKQYITQIAIWRYIEDGVESGTYKRSNPNLLDYCSGSGVTCSYNKNVALEKTVKSLLTGAKNARKNGYAKSSISVKPKSTSLTLTGNYYQSEFLSATCGNISNFSVSVASPYQIVDSKGKVKSSFSCSEKFAVRIAANKVTKNASVNIKISANSSVSRAYEYYPKSKSSSVQPIIIAGTYAYKLNIEMKLNVIRSCSCKGDYACALSFCKDASDRKKCATSCGVKDPGFSKCSNDTYPNNSSSNCDTKTKETLTSKTCQPANTATYYKTNCTETNTITYAKPFPQEVTIGTGFEYNLGLSGSKSCTLTFEKSKWNYDYLISNDNTRSNLVKRVDTYNNFNKNSLSDLTYQNDASINIKIKEELEDGNNIEKTKTLIKTTNGTTKTSFSNSKKSKLSTGKQVYDSKTYNSESTTSTYKLPYACLDYGTGKENENVIFDRETSKYICSEKGTLTNKYFTSENAKIGKTITLTTFTKSSLNNRNSTNECYYNTVESKKEEPPQETEEPEEEKNDCPDPSSIEDYCKDDLECINTCLCDKVGIDWTDKDDVSKACAVDDDDNIQCRLCKNLPISTQVVYRPISLTDPFPKRLPGANWIGYVKEVITGKTIDYDNPEYVIKLTPKDIQAINNDTKDYNSKEKGNNAYVDYVWNKSEESGEYESKFIHTTFDYLFTKTPNSGGGS